MNNMHSLFKEMSNDSDREFENMTEEIIEKWTKDLQSWKQGWT